MGKLRLMTILGTRPEIIRLSATIRCCDRYFEQILVHTGQNYDYTLNQVFLTTSAFVRRTIISTPWATISARRSGTSSSAPTS